MHFYKTFVCLVWVLFGYLHYTLTENLHNDILWMLNMPNYTLHKSWKDAYDNLDHKCLDYF